MKKLLLVAVLLSGVYANQLSSGAVAEVQSLIRAYGYKCDTVTNQPSFSSWDGSVRVICNNNRYTYEIKDIGGRWTVFVK